jgi:predicted RNA-binding protein YlxR (DUF448 family)
LQRRQPPQRTCIACRSTIGKRELLRVVRTPSGGVELDLTGKKSGRGAYICRRAECWEAALKKDRLGSALKTQLSQEDRARLQAFAESLKDVAVA